MDPKQRPGWLQKNLSTLHAIHFPLIVCLSKSDIFCRRKLGDMLSCGFDSG